MALVEETASYLNGAGRTESKKLERSAALVYATEEHAADNAADATRPRGSCCTVRSKKAK